MAGTICGTPLCMAPQVVDDEMYSYKADIWSLGVSYFELLTGRIPFNGQSLDEISDRMKSGRYTLEMKDKPSLECLQIIIGCLSYNEK